MHFKLISLLTLVSLALARPDDISDLGKDIASDFEGIGSDIVGDAKTAWEEIESHLPTFHYPTSVIDAIETGIKGIPDDVKSAVSKGEDAGKAVFDDVKSDVLKHTTVPSWVSSLPTEVQNAFSTDVAKAQAEINKASNTAKTVSATSSSTDNAAAPRQTHLAAGAAGVFGILGLVAAL
ncbi:hypothetical protein KEM56_007300 [Ascosphaera pollenicola]|nr:hypothetical protein KEM56_007300 [Ascosphaera pollenicola]